jgi:beta-glucosidase
MVKNHGNATLPISKRLKGSVTKRHFPAIPGIWGGMSEEKTDYPISLDLVKKYYDVTDKPAEADFALCLIAEPAISMGYDTDDVSRGGNGYIPMSLQYNDYTATEARETSIGGGDPLEKSANRSYKGKTVQTRNHDDLTMVTQTKEAMGDKPVVVVVETVVVVVFMLVPVFQAVFMFARQVRGACFVMVSVNIFHNFDFFCV